jgi:hypothetical protein
MRRIYDKSVSIAYPRLTDFCVAIAIPKSGVLSPQIGARHTNYYRTWWMTQGTVDPGLYIMRRGSCKLKVSYTFSNSRSNKKCRYIRPPENLKIKFS